MSDAPPSHQWRITLAQQWPDERPQHQIEATEIGEPGPNPQSPDAFIFVDDGDTAVMLLHVFYPKLEYHLRTVAMVWNDWIVVGLACRCVLVSIRNRTQRTIALSDERPPSSFDYFCHILCDQDYLLVCSARRVLRIDHDGEVLWKSTDVGLDGVIAHRVGDGVIEGSGEWDPPGGWRPFTLSLATGKVVP